jgi:hypothetical protein
MGKLFSGRLTAKAVRPPTGLDLTSPDRDNTLLIASESPSVFLPLGRGPASESLEA